MRKKQYIFWKFSHNENIIKKADNTICLLCDLCKKVVKIQFVKIIPEICSNGKLICYNRLFFSISIVWIVDEHFIKNHNLSKLTFTKSHLSRISWIKTIALVTKRNTRLPFIPITFEQHSNFRLILITSMVKKHFFYSQMENVIFLEFVASCSIGAISTVSILPYLGNTICGWVI